MHHVMSIWFTVIIQSQREPLSVEAWYWHWYLVVRNWINFLFILYLKRSGARVIHLSIFFSSLSGDYFVLPSRSAVTTHQQMGVLLVRQMMEKMVVGIQGHAVLCSPSSPHFVRSIFWLGFQLDLSGSISGFWTLLCVKRSCHDLPFVILSHRDEVIHIC